MFRISVVSIIGLTSAALASAGQISVGGVNGLTSSYITSGCSGAACVAGSTSTAAEQNYDTVLFAGVKNGANSPTPYSTYSQTVAHTGTITDPNGAGGTPVTFSMINDGASANGSNNFWALAQNSGVLPTMTIPIGVFGVSDVWTMINLEQAYSNTQNRDVTLLFNFGTTSNATTVQTVVVKLTNSSNSTSNAGQVRNAVDCVPGTASCQGISNAANGPLAASTPAGVGSATVYTNNLYTFAADGSRTLNLDDQGVYFNNLALSSLGAGATNLNTYLVSMQVREAGYSGTAPDFASLGLSAVTLDTSSLFRGAPLVPNPEPSTIAMFLTGLGVVGFGVLRRRRC